MYKYRLHYLLRQLTLSDYSIAMKWLPEQLCISQDTWRKWVYRKIDDPTEIPRCQLEKIATFFQCSVDDLITPALNTKKVNLWNKFKQHLLNS